MAIDPGSVVGQVEAANDKLAEYFSNMAKFTTDFLGTDFAPDFEDYVDVLDYSELNRMVRTRFSDSASFENGAAIENISMMVAITREYNLRSKNKMDYYADASSEYSSESNYYSTMKIFWMNMIRGNYVEGKTS